MQRFASRYGSSWACAAVMLLVGCSGGEDDGLVDTDAGIDGGSAPGDHVEPGPDARDAGTTDMDSGASMDAGVDASLDMDSSTPMDGSADAAADASLDASDPDPASKRGQ